MYIVHPTVHIPNPSDHFARHLFDLHFSLSMQKSVYESAMFLAIVSTCLMLNSSINGCIYFCAGKEAWNEALTFKGY